jgi:hypothetical protein
MVRTPLNEDKLSQPEWMKYYEIASRWARVFRARGGVCGGVSRVEKARFITGTIVDVTGGMLI